MNAWNRRNPTSQMILTDAEKLIMMIGRKTLGKVHAEFGSGEEFVAMITNNFNIFLML